MLKNYTNYIEKVQLLEALRNFPLFLSKRLRDTLSSINHEIAKELLSMHSDLETRVSKTFLDISIDPLKNDYFTFIQPNKVAQLLNLEFQDDSELINLDKNILDNLSDDSVVYNRYRSEVRIGSYIRTLFGDKYPNSLTGGQNRKDIESFVNLYKSVRGRGTKFNLMDIVSGEDISYWYNCSHYYNKNEGSLGGSCMKYRSSSTFQIYTLNPEKVHLVILYHDDEKTKIIGRSILWDLDTPEGRSYMDRVYTYDYSDEQIFIDFAKENGWLYKSQQSMGNDYPICDPRDDSTKSLNMIIQLNEIDYDYFPYCDTMSLYNSKTHKLSNKNNINPNRELCSTEGDYDTIGDEDEDYEMVHSNLHDEDIRKSNAVYCVYGDDWVYSGEEIKVYNTGSEEREYAVPNYDGIVKESFRWGNTLEHQVNKHFLKEKCIWSDYLNSWLFKDSTVSVWLYKDKTQKGLDHKKRKDNQYFEIDGENYARSLVNPETKELL